MSKPPKGSVFRFKEIVNRFDQLQRIGADYLDEQRLDGKLFRSYTVEAGQCLGMDETGIGLVADALEPYYGRTFNRLLRVQLSWRLAGGYSVLKKNRPLADKFRTVPDRWAGFMVTAVEPAMRSKRGTPQVLLRMRIVTGIFSGLSFEQRFPYKYVTKIMAKDLGMPRFKGAAPLSIVQMFGVALLTTPRDTPRMTDLYTPPGAKALNKALNNLRAKPCMWDYTWPCRNCPVGYADGAEGCGRAVHETALVKRFCPGCKRRNWFHPNARVPICLHCDFSRARSGA